MNAEEPIVVSTLGPTLYWFVMVVILLLVLAPAMASIGINSASLIALAIVLIPVTGLYAYVLWSLWFLPVRRATFYQDRIVVEGRNFKREIPYTEIERLSLENTAASLLYGKQIRIRVRGEAKPFTVFRNRLNSKFNRALEDWLGQVFDHKSPTSLSGHSVAKSQ